MEITWKFWKPGFKWNARLENTFLAAEFRMQQLYYAYYSWSLKNISEKVVEIRKPNFYIK